MSRAVDWLAALGGVVAGVLGTLAVAAKIYGGRNASDAVVSSMRAEAAADLIKLKDELRVEVEGQRDQLAADNEKLKEKLIDMERRMAMMERQMYGLTCTLAPTCPNRALPKGARA